MWWRWLVTVSARAWRLRVVVMRTRGLMTVESCEGLVAAHMSQQCGCTGQSWWLRADALAGDGGVTQGSAGTRVVAMQTSWLVGDDDSGVV